eukprot:2274038-Rhodomonas_salina.1
MLRPPAGGDAFSQARCVGCRRESMSLRERPVPSTTPTTPTCQQLDGSASRVRSHESRSGSQCTVHAFRGERLNASEQRAASSEDDERARAGAGRSS